MKSISVILLSAGNSSRIRTNKNKTLLKVNNKHLLQYSIDIFLSFKVITQIIIVYNSNDLEIINKMKNKYNSNKLVLVEGGSNRNQSIINGCTLLNDNEYVLIHDGARPLLNGKVVKDLISKSSDKAAIIPTVEVEEGIKRVENHVIKEHISRDNLVSCQTPQLYDKNTLLKGLDLLKQDKYRNYGLISIILELGVEISTLKLSRSIKKITTQEDLEFYKFILRKENKK